MAAQGESQIRPTMGDWQEDVVEAREILRAGKPTVIRPQEKETADQYRHRLHVLQSDPTRLQELRGQHTAAASVDHRATWIPTEAVCGTCAGPVGRIVEHGVAGISLGPWTHHDGLDEPHPVLPTFPEEG